jgi:hypothetical protein
VRPARARDEARRHWRQALAIHADLKVPEADDVRANLNLLDPPAGRSAERVVHDARPSW